MEVGIVARMGRSIRAVPAPAMSFPRSRLGHAGLEGVEGEYGRSQMVDQRAQAAELVAAALDGIRLGETAQVVPLRERYA